MDEIGGDVVKVPLEFPDEGEETVKTVMWTSDPAEEGEEWIQRWVVKTQELGANCASR
jgi:hypothetical protein